ncbi:hypothetical protein GCM10010492_21490 [Saccharothrix mutabilis subsp. mutabilis]|uniref:ABC transporter substrate-binding protein n=1 Tax=Saccharothrix mutabilis subsp. mutabilis TaxID=66855 RepID=A0ABN0TJB9_9PSEU
MRKALAFLLVAGLLTACTDDPADPGQPVGPAEPGTLRVLAGSELADMRPVLEEAAKATGVSVEFSFTGTAGVSWSLGAADGGHLDRAVAAGVVDYGLMNGLLTGRAG